MKPTTEILARISQNSLANKEEVFTKLYRYLLRPDIYFVAYKNLYANNGAATKGVNEDTADGFSEAKIDSIIKALADETYQPMPVRRTYIQKKNNRKKLRPLGIPTFTDKLVQEVLRMILEAVYEPIFLDVSHGFRPKRSCHTALKQLRREFNGTRWFVEGDIKGCFDNINHAVLVGLLNNKIKDARITKLIYKFLKAGYLENWQYHKTYSGTPQGGLCGAPHNPPCGVPSSVWNSSSRNTNPAFKNCFRTDLSIGIFSINHSWLMWSKHPLMSPSSTHCGEFLRLNAVKMYSQASCAQRPLRKPKDFASAVVSDTGSRARA